MERYLRVNLLVPDPLLIEKRIYRAAVSQRLRNTALEHLSVKNSRQVSRFLEHEVRYFRNTALNLSVAENFCQYLPGKQLG